MPADPETRRGAGDGEVIDHDGFQRPAHPAAGQLRPGLGRRGGVLPPDPPAAGALVAANTDQQRRWPMPERDMRQPARHRVARSALGPATPAPRIRLEDPALQHRSLRAAVLADDDDQAKVIEIAERGQIGGRESRVRQRRGLPSDGRVGTSILEDLDPYPATAPRPRLHLHLRRA